MLATTSSRVLVAMQVTLSGIAMAGLLAMLYLLGFEGGASTQGLPPVVDGQVLHWAAPALGMSIMNPAPYTCSIIQAACTIIWQHNKLELHKAHVPRANINVK